VSHQRQKRSLSLSFSYEAEPETSGSTSQTNLMHVMHETCIPTSSQTESGDDKRPEGKKDGQQLMGKKIFTFLKDLDTFPLQITINEVKIYFVLLT